MSNVQRWGGRVDCGARLAALEPGTPAPAALILLVAVLCGGCRSEPAPGSGDQPGSGEVVQAAPAENGETSPQAAEASWPESFAALLPPQSGVVGLIHLDQLEALETEGRLPPLDWWAALDIVPGPGDAQDFYAFLRQRGVDTGRPVVFASYEVERHGLLEAARSADWLFGRAPMPDGVGPEPRSVQERITWARRQAAGATAGLRLLVPVEGTSTDAILALVETALGDAEPLVPPPGTQVLRAFRLSSHTLAFVRLVEGFAVVDLIVPGADQAVAAAASALEPMADGPVETAARPVAGEVLALSVVDETPAAYELATVMTNVVQATTSDVIAPEDWPVILSHGVDFGARTRDLFWPGPLDALADRGFRLALDGDALSVELWQRGGDGQAVASGAATLVYLAGRATVQFPKATLATPTTVWRELGVTPLPPSEVDREALGWMFGANQSAVPRLVARLALGLAEAVPEPVRAAIAASGEAESIVLPFDRPGEPLSAFGVVLLPGASDEAANALLLCFEQGVAPPYCPGGQLEIDEQPRRLAAGDSAAHLRGWSYRLAPGDDRPIIWLEAPGVHIETAGTRLAAGLDNVVGLVSVDVGPLASSDSEGERLLAGQLSGLAGRDRLDALLEPGSAGLTWRLPYRPGERTPTPAQRPQFVPALELAQDMPIEVPGPCARFGDTDGDARLDEVARHTYDSAGRLVVTEVDRDLDGEADRRIQYRYPTADAGAGVSFEDRDLDGDGQSDETVRRQYDTEGELLIELTMGDGGWAVLRTFERNEEDGSVFVYVRQASAEGSLDEAELVDIRPPPGESVPWRVEETDASGRVTARRVELSGGMTQTTRYEYDTAGNLLSEITTQTGYGGERPVSHHRFDYGCWRLDADGQLVLPDHPMASAHRAYDLTSLLEGPVSFGQSEAPEGTGDAHHPSRVETPAHPH